MAEPAAARRWRALARFLAGLFHRRGEVAGGERAPLPGALVVEARDRHTLELVHVFLVSLLPTGCFALSWAEHLDRVRREARGFLAVLVDRDLRDHLLGRRRAIVAEFQDLMRLVPEPVLDGAAR